MRATYRGEDDDLLPSDHAPGHHQTSDAPRRGPATHVLVGAHRQARRQQPHRCQALAPRAQAACTSCALGVPPRRPARGGVPPPMPSGLRPRRSRSLVWAPSPSPSPPPRWMGCVVRFVATRASRGLGVDWRGLGVVWSVGGLVLRGFGLCGSCVCPVCVPAPPRCLFIGKKTPGGAGQISIYQERVPTCAHGDFFVASSWPVAFGHARSPGAD